MGREIERKFLVCSDAWKSEATSERSLRQGYLAIDSGSNVRVRTDGERAWLTIKGRGEGITRPEFEYEIPAADAAPLLDLCQNRMVEKKRHLVPVGDRTWEIDEFSGENIGLVVAEIELPDEGTAFALPAWLGAEVTGDPRYLNASLAVHPFARWAR
jgi:adenylate cyclase